VKALTDWQLRGEYMESCNCDYLCPCIYTNPQEAATNDNCTALMVYRIDDGQYGETKLDGLHFALVIRSGPVMADGDWIFGCVADDSATPDQKTALEEILSGNAGGTLAALHQNVVGDFRGVTFAPITFGMDGIKRETNIPDILSFAITGVTSRMNPDAVLAIDNTSHPANTRLSLARASHMHIQAFGLDLEIAGAGNNGHFAPFDWHN